MVLFTAEPISLIEPVPIKDELCSMLARIEDVDGFGARFILVSQQTVHEANVSAFVITNKIVLPYSSVPHGIDLAVAFMARRAISIAGANLLRLVKG